MITRKYLPKYFNKTLDRFYSNSYEEIIGTEPQLELFTKFLSQIKQDKNDNIIQPSIQRNPYFQVGKSQYFNFADQNPLGSIIQFKHKDVDLSLLSTSFSCKDVAGIYKSIQKIKPSIVLVEVRPDALLNDFELITKNNQVFSDRLYFKQLQRSPFQVMPSSQMRTDIINKLKGRVTMKNIQQSYVRQYKRKLLEAQQFTSFISREGINNYVIGTGAYYCQRNNLPMVLCSLPEISQRQILANTHTLMELQVIFKKTCQQLANYSKVTPRKIANFVFPEVFMNPGDKYMFTLIQYLIAKNEHKNILVLTGVMRNHAIKQYLSHRNIENILSCIYPPKPEGSILRTIQNHEVIQKHCLLDVMQFGKQILKTQISSLMSTNKLSYFYADPHHIKKQQTINIMNFRIDMYKKYLHVLQDCIQVGQNIRTKQFIRKAIES